MVKNPPAYAGDGGDVGSDLWIRKSPSRREWQPTPVSLPGEFQGQRTPAGCSPWGSQRVRRNQETEQAVQALSLKLPLMSHVTSSPRLSMCLRSGVWGGVHRPCQGRLGGYKPLNPSVAPPGLLCPGLGEMDLQATPGRVMFGCGCLRGLPPALPGRDGIYLQPLVHLKQTHRPG